MNALQPLQKCFRIFSLFLLFQNFSCYKINQTFGIDATFQRMDSAQWGYEGKNWEKLFDSCNSEKNARSQSPIDIPTKNLNTSYSDLKINYSLTKFYFIHKGLTVEAWHEKKNDMVFYKGEIYHLENLHFHTPSEHKIDGKDFPLELHFVNKNKKGDILELSVFAQINKENKENENISKLVNSLPEARDYSSQISELDINQMIPINTKHFEYTGSITAPPCTEGIQWLVMENPIEITKSSLELFKKILGTNARPVQEIFARKVVRVGNVGRAGL